MKRPIRAAGGVVFRTTKKGNLKVLVAHRPRYDDWSFPKGKANPGETQEQTAVREVLEETGYHCRIVTAIGTTKHRLASGNKEVSWFAMRPLPDTRGFKKNSEVDRIKWLTRKAAHSLLDYPQDRDLLAGHDFGKIAQTGTIRLLRHGAAGDRNQWLEEDWARPLNKKGRKQAEAIAESLADMGVDRVVSSPYLRCVQTVEPLALKIGARVEISDALAEGPDIDAAYELVGSLVGYNAVLSSHGDVIPAVINRMTWEGLSIDSPFQCSKGSIWETEVDEGRFTTCSYVPPPRV